MARFIAVYSGPSIGTAELVAVSADPRLVADVAARMLKAAPHVAAVTPAREGASATLAAVGRRAASPAGPRP